MRSGTWLTWCALFAMCALCVDEAFAVRLRAEPVLTTGISKPIYGAPAPGDPGKMYILEQTNQRIVVLDLATKQLSTFLDLPNAGGGPHNGNGERGFKGLAFHPDYATNGKFYVHQYAADDIKVNILEFTRSSTDPTIADPASQRTIISWDHIQPTTNGDHSAGSIDFSPNDGYLYIPTGDGGSNGPAAGTTAQDLNDIRGKLLRIDVNGDDFPADADRNYAIPEANPFAEGGGLPEIIASGLRHPYRSSFDRDTGDLYMGDVGWNRFGEVNRYEATDNDGGVDELVNYGWRYYEGDQPHPSNSGDPIPPDAVDPVYSMSHSPDLLNQGDAIIGGYVYRGSAIPELFGDYIFGNIRRRSFFTFDSEGDASDIVDRSAELRSPLVPSGNHAGVATFAEDDQGELYFMDLFAGNIFKIVAGIDGDYDVDGDVDADDLQLWSEHYASTENLWADGNGDGVVNSLDYAVWRDNLTPPAGGTSTPEPAALAMLLVSGVVASTTRGRRQGGSRP